MLLPRFNFFNAYKTIHIICFITCEVWRVFFFLFFSKHWFISCKLLNLWVEICSQQFIILLMSAKSHFSFWILVISAFSLFLKNLARGLSLVWIFSENQHLVLFIFLIVSFILLALDLFFLFKYLSVEAQIADKRVASNDINILSSFSGIPQVLIYIVFIQVSMHFFLYF